MPEDSVSSYYLDLSPSLSHHSSFLILPQLLLGFLLLCCSWRFQLKTYFSMAQKCFLSVSDPFPFLQLDLHCHMLLLSMPQQFFV